MMTTLGFNPSGPGAPGLALSALLLAICCGGPLLLAALGAAGLGAGFAADGSWVAGIAFVAAGLAALGWRRLRRAAVYRAPHHDREVASRD